MIPDCIFMNMEREQRVLVNSGREILRYDIDQDVIIQRLNYSELKRRFFPSNLSTAYDT